jgi:hypothetical protein
MTTFLPQSEPNFCGATTFVTKQPNPARFLHPGSQKFDTFACLKIMHRVCLLFLFFIFLTIGARAQRSSELGVSGGVSYYVGELNPGRPFTLVQPAYGLFYRLNLNSRIAWQLHANKGKVKGDDAISNFFPNRQLNFESPVTEIGVQFEVNFMDYFIGSVRHRITPYIFGGAGIFMFKPTGIINGTKTELQPLTTEGQGLPGRQKEYKLTSVSFPMGIGGKFSINRYVGLGFEWGVRKTTTDYLDDISTTYYLDLAGKTPGEVSPAELASDPTLSHNAEMQRGNSKNKDWYSFALVSVSVKIRMLEKKRCLDNQSSPFRKSKGPKN